MEEKKPNNMSKKNLEELITKIKKLFKKKKEAYYPHDYIK